MIPRDERRYTYRSNRVGIITSCPLLIETASKMSMRNFPKYKRKGCG
jgi:hypothetical protein